jgi:hypothetical protein
MTSRFSVTLRHPNPEGSLMANTTEHQRINGANAAQWRKWGSYVFSRSWGTVRESADTKQAWEVVPFEYARSRAATWSEDGIAGFSDDQQRLCLTSAFWNGQDPFLKERFFGLSNNQGNHGEDVKDYFFFVDGMPSYSYMKMVYRYPQVEFPYQRLLQENQLRKQDEPPFQLIDALPNTFAEHRYFDITIEFAKASENDLLYRITSTNCSDQPAPLHILPQLFYRNTWGKSSKRPLLRASEENSVIIEHPDFTGYHWYVESPDELLFTENETNFERLFDGENLRPYSKDGIDDAVVRGQKDRVNPEKAGTKCAAHYKKVLAPEEVWVVRSRLSPYENAAPFDDFDAIFATRQEEADEFYQEVQHGIDSEEERRLQRAAFAGLVWNKNFYHFNVKRWLDEVATEETKLEEGHPFKGWEHFDAHDILSVPDPWEYPWLASWDLSFQIVTLAFIDVEFARQQALLILSDRYMRRNGAMAAFEGDLNTPHPPVHAWAVWHIYQVSQDRAFLEAAYEPLKRHFNWWLEAHQPEDYLFDGGFLGKDNISILDRSGDIPEGGHITQVDSTGWMTFFALNMVCIAVELSHEEDANEFLDHFLSIRKSLQRLWDKKDRFFYDVVQMPSGKRVKLKGRSLAGLIPLVAVMTIEPHALDKLPAVREHIEELARNRQDFAPNEDGMRLISALPQKQIKLLLDVLLDPEEFCSPFGLRSLSKVHKEQQVKLELEGKSFELSYAPGYSKQKMLGGNSNWRGPIWSPLNHVFIEALYTYHDYFKTPVVQQTGKRLTLEETAQQLVRRIMSIFEPDQHGHLPYLGNNQLFQKDPEWHDLLWFYEHFHAETGEGLGASHQNGWTAFVATLIQNQGRGKLSIRASED